MISTELVPGIAVPGSILVRLFVAVSRSHVPAACGVRPVARKTVSRTLRPKVRMGQRRIPLVALAHITISPATISQKAREAVFLRAVMDPTAKTPCDFWRPRATNRSRGSAKIGLNKTSYCPNLAVS